ncbi:ABC transporter permease [Clostridium nigeriense]|uniref:ABC transporter permease n=1 Tax=Clostridium nigeriense TaxID=1805470 RepID=UPI00082A5340|nr:ABC transporter permease [Clostridium nigeriense]
MKILTIVKYRLLQSVRDVQSLISMLLIPIFLILILGNALKNNEDFTARTVDKVNLLYVNDDSTNGAKAFENFITLDELGDIIQVEKINNIEEGKKLIENRKYDALVVYDENYDGKLELIGSEYNQLGVSIVKGIVETYSSSANAMEALGKIQSRNFTLEQNNNLQDEAVSVSGKKPSAIDYYAITMLVMIIMYGSIYANFAIDKSYYGAVGSRFRSTPLNLSQIFIGEAVGVIITIMVQVLILLLISNFAFGVNFGSSIPTILLSAFSLSVLSTMLGIFAIMATKKGLIGLALLNVIVPIFTFLSGGFVKVNFGGILGSIAKLTPNYLASNAMFKSIYGGASKEVFLSILGLWIISALLFLGANVIGRSERV